MSEAQKRKLQLLKTLIKDKKHMNDSNSPDNVFKKADFKMIVENKCKSSSLREYKGRSSKISSKLDLESIQHLRTVSIANKIKGTTKV